MKPRQWQDLKLDFRRLVARKGVVNMATEINVHRTSVYRMLKDGGVLGPRAATRAEIERAVKEQQEPKS